MCTVCGCGESHINKGEGHKHDHDHHPHTHDHDHPDGCLHFGHGDAGLTIPDMSQSRIIQVERDILSKNDMYAETNRARLTEKGVFTLNLVSSPGSGKTTLLVKTVFDLKGHISVAVIEGDQQTAFDADRIRETGVPARQINTGKGCHLDAHMVGHALDDLDLPDDSVLFIENVGNLVCPAAFDLGEAHKVVILSVTEGEDKPLKYPDMFAAADLMILTKSDLLPHVPFNVDRCLDFARRVNPKIEILQLSSTTGEGLNEWYDWIEARRARSSTDVKLAGE